VIIPVYNEELRLGDCLRSIFEQTYPVSQLEVLIIDDCSTDKTLDIAGNFPVQVITNGAKDCEVGKALGINQASGDFLLFMDADNRLVDKNWLGKAVRLLLNDPEIVRVQSWKFTYSRDAGVANRYHALWGNTDPLVYYLQRQDHVRQYDRCWSLTGRILTDMPEYVCVCFQAAEMPTLGSQGFLTRRVYFAESLPTFHHTEFFIRLVKQLPRAYFVFLKTPVTHLPFSSFRSLQRMFSRNLGDFLRDSNKYKIQRYSLSWPRMLKVLLITQTIIRPLYDATRGFWAIHDPAWFIHVYLSLVVPWIYLRQLLYNGKIHCVFSGGFGCHPRNGNNK
jgi:glycosyltransferase involved in cell wall biosynthesis